MLIRPAKCLRGEITLPGDKSISHRAAMIAGMAEGPSRIENFATSVDCASTLACLRQLGVEIEQAGTTVSVRGVGKAGFQAPSERLNCGNSGTTMRLLAGILAGQDFESVMTGDRSLERRPMRRVAEPLRMMGAGVETTDGHAPLTISGRNPLASLEYRLPVASAQVKSCVLLAGLFADGTVSVIEPVPTRDHTERMLRWFGVEIASEELDDGRRISIEGPRIPSGRDLKIPADISAAAFFAVAAACLPGSDIRMPDVGLNPTRAGVLDVLMNDLGASIAIADEREHNNEPVADISVDGQMKTQRSNKIMGTVVANLIDELPILAVLGTKLDEGLEVRDAGELRHKETDRIAAVVENLRRMNAEVEEFDDGFRVGRSRLKGARVDSFDDHRIAMAFAIAGLLAEDGDTEIDGAGCVDVSFPGFFEVLKNVVVYK